MGARRGVVAVAVGVLWATPACYESVEVQVFNPCNHRVEVEAWAGDTPAESSRAGDPVDPVSVAVLEGDVMKSPTGEYTAEVYIPVSADADLLDVRSDDDLVQVLIPAHMCE